MATYIEREAVLAMSFCTAPATMINPYGGDSVVRVEDIENLPAADVVEVVRCKDCKHYWSYGRTSMLIDDKNIKCGWCRRRIRYDEEHRMLPDDFCSYGVRRDNDG